MMARLSDTTVIGFRKPAEIWIAGFHAGLWRAAGVESRREHDKDSNRCPG
jgi:hypothetical protein